ncbi:hypothetical protein MmiAt1_13140 [Methanimicrococcus sp. At1]|uniref:Uncharacterized protein n=1 Tax=Methanimicrococcus hacksteinii TaxID=3028293 RepID=A0ABU3VS49_9EURY|nr:hypothetical protein [Methanimicrococcus sp. At1]MDV0445720.1 hypothetical protein [Methanimicrococcus sp. At1]
MDKKEYRKNMDINKIFGTINNISILINIKDFKFWMAQKHQIESTDFKNEYFEGYKFAIETLVRTLIDGIRYEKTFEFTQSELFYRACYTGANLNKIPDDCEKTRVIKKIYSYFEKMNNATNPIDFEKQSFIFKKIIIDSLLKIYNDSIQTNNETKLTKEETLNYCSIWVTLIYLNDARKGEPFGYTISPTIYSSNKNKKTDENIILNGYKYAIQYLWSKLLKDYYEKTSIKQIHSVKNWKNELYFNNKNQKNKKAFDDYFGIINKEIIEENLKNKMERLDVSVFLWAQEPDKSALKKLMNAPQWIELTESERIDQLLLWYPVEIMEGIVFNGSSTFIPQLIGLTEIKKAYDEKVHVRRFIHPINDRDYIGNDYSYGILIDAFSNIADYSCWIIFYDCCGDYSGFGGSEHQAIEEIIEKYNDKIIIQQTIIEKNRFYENMLKKEAIRYNNSNEFITYRKKTGRDIRILRRDYEETLEKLNASKGLLVELLTYYIETENLNPENEIKWSHIFLKNEHDVWIENKNKIKICECKADAETRNIDADLKKIENKKSIVEEQYKKECNNVFWYYKEPENEMTMDRLNQLPIECKFVRSELIRMGKKKDKLDDIFKK